MTVGPISAALDSRSRPVSQANVEHREAIGMANAALIWSENEALRAQDLPQEGATSIGRAPGSGITLPVETVSRQQTSVRFDGTRYLVDNLSRTNPTLLNGAPVAESRALSDGDTVRAGSVELTFHDLSVGDRISGPVCSHCGRENPLTQRDCWYCGTSMVSAATTVRRRIRVGCRLVGADGRRWEIHPGHSIDVSPEGTVTTLDSDSELGQAALRLTCTEEGVQVGAVPGTEGATINGDRAAEGLRLRTGDRVEVGPVRGVVIVR